MKPAVRLFLIVLLAALTAACAQVRRPDQNLAERLEYDQAARLRYQLDAEWWKNYNDPQLNQLVDRALATNIDLAKAAVSVNRALYQAKLIAADLVPSFSGDIDATARKNIKEGGPSTRSVSGSITLSYEVDLWRKVADAASAQEWEYRATIEDLENTRLVLINSVVDAYYNLAYLQDALASARANVRNFRAIENTVAAKHQAGKVAAVELAQARQSVLSGENTLVDLESQHKTAEQTLRDLLNLKPGDDLGLTGLTLADLKLPPLDLDIPLAVLANRPDLKAAEFRLEKALKNVSEAEKGWLPSINISSALSSSGDKFNNAFNTAVGSVGLSVSLPFLDWSNVLYNLRISETDFETVRLDFEQALTTALNEVDTYYFTFTKSLQTLSNTRKKFAYDARISAYYRDRYQAGAGELSDWLSAVNTANSSRLTALSDLYQAVKSENMVFKALAGRYVDTAGRK